MSASPLSSSLGSLLLHDADIGLPLDADAGADHLDLHDAALLEPDAPAELARLRTRGYVGGAARCWAGPGRSVVQITLHRFRSSTDAQLSLDDLRSALIAATASERVFADGVVMTISAEAMCGAVGGLGAAHALVAHAALTRRADVAVMVVTTGEADGLCDRNGAFAQDLAILQRARLAPERGGSAPTSRRESHQE